MEPSDTQKILSAIGALGDRIGRLETRMDSIETHMVSIDAHMDGLDARMNGFDARMDSFESRMETRMSAMEERTADLVHEMRAGFEKIDHRLITLEDEVGALSKTFDTILESDVLGKDHITLIRPEYDTMVSTLHLPNRFTKV